MDDEAELERCVIEECGELTTTCLGTSCGDGVCEWPEALPSCPEDCAVCGDRECSPGEDVQSCPWDCSPPPPNDRCEQAQLLPAQDGSVDGSTFGAAADHAAEQGRGPDVFYGFRLEQHATVTLELRAQPPWDSYIYLLGGSCARPRLVAQADDGGEGGLSRLEARGLIPGDYWIVVAGARARAAGSFTLVLGLAGFLPACHDGICSLGPEDEESCPQDCLVCGDGRCYAGSEDLAGCPQDCAVCGDGVCSRGVESLALCGADCGGRCGDWVCSQDAEDEGSCRSDCGTPLNDLCVDAVVLQLGLPVQGTTSRARRDFRRAMGPDVFYRFRLEQPAAVEVLLGSLPGRIWDTYLYLASGPCEALVLQDESDDEPWFGWSRIASGQLPAGEHTVVVSGFAEGSSGPFDLTVQAVDRNAAPQLRLATARVEGSRLVLRLEAADQEGNALQLEGWLVDESGERLEEAPAFLLRVSEREPMPGGGAGAFLAWVEWGGLARQPLARSVELTLIDTLGARSEVLLAQFTELPRQPAGEPCDPRRRENRCQPGSLCRETEVLGRYLCVAQLPPEIVALSAFASPAGDLLGLQLSGHDPERDARGLRLRLLGEGDAPLEAEERTLPFERVVWAAEGPDFQAWARLALPQGEGRAPLLAVQAAAYDAAEGLGGFVRAPLGEAPLRSPGDTCDAGGLFDRCPAGWQCLPGESGSPTCQEPPPE
ncbi:MAG: hypothetical protein FJ125_09925 [Deltaproteobacteria bacterium]|nr:hypothetical protein [Deltaproteobacteria bacterium]